MKQRKKAMIVAAQPEPTEAGAEILRAGGNAVDAAIACALVQGVVDPMMCDAPLSQSRFELPALRSHRDAVSTLRLPPRQIHRRVDDPVPGLAHGVQHVEDAQRALAHGFSPSANSRIAAVACCA